MVASNGEAAEGRNMKWVDLGDSLGDGKEWV